MCHEKCKTKVNQFLQMQKDTETYKKTGDLITLPYTDKEFAKQPYAT